MSILRKPKQIKILIGGDYYYRFAKTNFTRYERGLMVPNSCFGHILWQLQRHSEAFTFSTLFDLRNYIDTVSEIA